MINKIALGTVQLGLNYGINNNGGQVAFEEAVNILSLCRKLGIDTLDTAHAYGNSEETLGEIGIENFKVISKLPPSETLDFSRLFHESLDRLKINSLYGYMLHNFSIYKNDKSIWEKLQQFKSEGLISRIGVSLYSPEELEELDVDNINFDIIQVPHNLFDRRFEPYFESLKEKGVEIHTRSAFLQGLFFKSAQNLPTHFESIKGKFEQLENFKSNNKLETVEACLGYILKNPNIDKVVIGVDSSSQLQANINSINNLSDNIDWSHLNDLSINDLNIINPSLWKV